MPPVSVDWFHLQLYNEPINLVENQAGGDVFDPGLERARRKQVKFISGSLIASTRLILSRDGTTCEEEKISL